MHPIDYLLPPPPPPGRMFGLRSRSGDDESVKSPVWVSKISHKHPPSASPKAGGEGAGGSQGDAFPAIKITHELPYIP
jgi:hypothetical protein